MQVDSGGSGKAPKKKKKKKVQVVIGPPASAEHAKRIENQRRPNNAVSPVPTYLTPRKPKVEKPNLIGMLFNLQKPKDTSEEINPIIIGPKNEDTINALRNIPKPDIKVESKSTDPVGPWANQYAPKPEDNFKEDAPEGTPWDSVLKPLAKKDPKKSSLEKFLKNVADPKALEGYNFIDPLHPNRTDHIVPENFKSDAWNRDYILNTLAMTSNPTGYNIELNKIIDDQFSDRERALFGGLDENKVEQPGIIRGQSDKIIKLLDDASKALDTFDGKKPDFNYIRNQMLKDPNVSLSLPTFESQFGVSSESLQKDWDERVKGMTPEQARQEFYTFSKVRDHYKTLEKKFGESRKFVNDRISKFETKYNDTLEKYENWSGEDADENKALAKKAGPAIPDLSPKPKKEDQDLIDKSAGSRGLSDLLAAPVGKSGNDLLKNKDNQDRKSAGDRLGIKKLPPIKDMLAVLVQQGNLDPEDDAAVEKAINRFKDPNHPDTRAMYAAFAQQFGGKKLKDEEILEYVNEPVSKYVKDENKRIADAEKARKEADKDQGFLGGVQKAIPVVGSYLSMLDDEGGKGGKERSGLERISDVQFTKGKGLEDSPGSGMSGLEWTLDKLSRLNYGVAGFADALYAQDKNDKPWHGQDGFFGGVLNAVTKPLTLPLELATGQNPLDSIDDIVMNPESGLEPFKAGYGQVFRGSNLPGVNDNIVPITFSQVIANNAARDPDNNIYDANWYQHVAGFALDAGTDPLNFIGIGLVDDVLKIPVRVSKDLRTAEGSEDAVHSSLALLNKYHEYKSPVASVVWRANQAIQKAGKDTSYMSEAGVFGSARSSYDPVGVRHATLSESAVGTPIKVQPFKQSLTELNEMVSKFVNDNGVNHLTEVLEQVAPGITKRADNTRVNVLEAKLGNMGYEVTQSLDAVAKGQGNTYISIGSDAASLPAKKAQLKHDELLKNIERQGADPKLYEKELAGYQKIIEDAADNNSIPGVKRRVDSAKYLEKGGKLPNEFADDASYRKAALFPDDLPKRPTGSLREGYAQATGYGTDVDRFPFSERQIHESLIQGPKFLRNTDRVAWARFDRSRAQVKNSTEVLREAKRTGKPADVIERADRNLKLALKSLRSDLYGASLRYLDALGEMQQGRALYSDPELAEKLIQRRKTIKSKLNASSEASLGTVRSSSGAKDIAVPTNSDGSVDEDKLAKLLEGSNKKQEVSDTNTLPDSNSAEYFEIDDESFRDYESIADEDLLDDSFKGGLTGDRHLEQLDRKLSQRIKDLRLDKDGKLTGLPPREAYKVGELIGDFFKKSDGSIDVEKINKSFYFNDPDWVRAHGGKADYQWYYVKLHPRMFRDADELRNTTEAFEIIRGAIQDEYRDAYVEVGNRMSRDKVAKSPVGTSDPITKAEETFKSEQGYTEKPKNSDPIKASAKYGSTNWAKRWPDGINGPTEILEEIYKGNLYDVFYVSGAPFNFTPPGRTRIALTNKEGKRVTPDYDSPAKTRNWASEQLVGKPWKDVKNPIDRELVNDYMREVAEAAAESLSKPILTKLVHDTWNASVKARSEKWDSGLKVARGEDKVATAKALKNETTRVGQLNPIEKAKMRREAVKTAKAAVLNSVINEQTVKRTLGNERLTINETARVIEREVKQDFVYKKNVIDIKIAFATEQNEVRALQESMKGLTKEKDRLLNLIEKSRIEGLETKQIMKRRADEEVLFNVIDSPTHMSTKAMQLRIMGFKKNFQMTNNLFDGMAIAEKLLPAAVYTNFANNWIRPTKHLDLVESITFRAMHESKTPVVIKSHLTTMSKRMGKITTTNRQAMFEAMRRGRNYGGAQSEAFGEFKKEMEELNDIFQGTHEFYKYKDINGRPSSLSLGQINAFLKDGYKMDLNQMYKVAQGRKITIDDVFEAIKFANPKAEIADPFVFSWHMRLAADQAQQTNAIHHLMRETFGVKRIGTSRYFDGEQGFVVKRNDSKALLVEKLKSKGWQTIPELGGAHYFPPEAIKDMKKLLEFMDPKADVTGMMKHFDTVLGYWKQGATIYNPGYYSRNGVGEIMASWLDGVNNPKYYRQSFKVIKYLKNNNIELSELIEKGASAVGIKEKDVLFKLKGGKTVSIGEILESYIDNGMMSTFANTDIDQGLRGISGADLKDSKLAKVRKGTSRKFHAAGEHFEDYLRMAHYIHAMENSGAGTVTAAGRHAASRVTKYHFDYTDFSIKEKSVMLRAFPFYKWTRRGAPLMLAHLFMTPGKIVAIPKVMDMLSGLNPGSIDITAPFTDDPLFSSADVHEDKNGHLPDFTGIAPAWIRDLFAYQMGPAEDDEYANYFRIQTPQIDGLNAALINPMDLKGTWSDPLQKGALPLLNPGVKAIAELGMNNSLDPDFNDYEIYGGAYNEGNQINKGEAIGAYLARTGQPGLGFLAKLSKNGDLGSKLSMGTGTYKDAHGYDVERDIASFLTGSGNYQAMPGKPKFKDKPSKSTPVGTYELSELPQFTGESPLSGSSKSELDAVQSTLNDLLSGKGSGLGSGGGSANYSGSGWKNFGYGGFGGGGYGGSGDFDLLAFLAKLARQIDQGQVYKGDMNND